MAQLRKEVSLALAKTRIVKSKIGPIIGNLQKPQKLVFDRLAESNE
jgi:hypothetical protein